MRNFAPLAHRDNVAICLKQVSCCVCSAQDGICTQQHSDIPCSTFHLEHCRGLCLQEMRASHACAHHELHSCSLILYLLASFGKPTTMSGTSEASAKALSLATSLLSCCSAYLHWRKHRCHDLALPFLGMVGICALATDSYPTLLDWQQQR